MNNVSPEFYWIVVTLVTVVSSARLDRLLIVDQFPPVVALRLAYLRATDRTEATRPYGLLALCGWCMSFWATLVVALWGYLAGVYHASPFTSGGESITNYSAHVWWLANGFFAVSYLTGMVMARDGDNDGDNYGANYGANYGDGA